MLPAAHPDLIVVDVDGQTLELLDDIPSGEWLTVDPDTPIIVLSHRPDDIHRVRVLDRGGDDIIAKPFSYPELRRVSYVFRQSLRAYFCEVSAVASVLGPDVGVASALDVVHRALNLLGRLDAQQMRLVVLVDDLKGRVLDAELVVERSLELASELMAVIWHCPRSSVS